MEQSLFGRFRMQPLDALTLKHLAGDLHGMLAGSKINKVQQLSRVEFLLHFWGPSGRHRLYINLNPEAACCFLLAPGEEWDFSLATPLPKPTGFCMLLRKYLTAAKVVDLKTLPGERVLNITFQHYNELGHLETLVLSLELMGKYTNMLLYQNLEQVILGAAHPVTEAMSRHREVAPGLPYLPPPRPAHKPFFWELPEAEFQQFLTHLTPEELPLALPRQFFGLSRSIVESVLQADPQPAQLYRNLLDLETGKRLCPALSPNGQAYRLLGLETWCSKASVHALVHDYYLAQIRQQSFQTLQRDLLHLLQHQAKKRQTLEQALQPVDEAQIAHTQKIGDLLFSALSTGTLPPSPPSSITLEDYETQAPQSISLDPSLSWVENAQRYYRRARKAKSQQAIYNAQAQRLADEQTHWAEMILWIQQADSLETLRHLKEELVQAGFCKALQVNPATRKSGAAADQPSGILKLRSSDGFSVWVGRSSQANGWLVGKLLKPHDVWLHVHNMPGSHVVIKTEQAAVPDPTLLEAATLAVYFSSARESKNVPVIYTEGRYLRKIPQSYPGHVNYREEQTVFITPQLSLVEELLATQAS